MVRHPCYPGGGTGAYVIDGTQVATFSENCATNTLVTDTVTAPSYGVHDLAVTDTAGSISLVGEEAYGASVSDVLVIAVGWSGAYSGNFNPGNSSATQAGNGSGPPWGGVQLLAVIYADVEQLSFGRNDQFFSVLIPVLMANYQAVINVTRPVGGTPLNDIYVIGEHQPNPNFWTNTTTLPNDANYVAAIKNVASNNGLPYLDVAGRLGTWQQMTAAGRFAPDKIHENTMAQDIEGAFEATAELTGR